MWDRDCLNRISSRCLGRSNAKGVEKTAIRPLLSMKTCAQDHEDENKVRSRVQNPPPTWAASKGLKRSPPSADKPDTPTPPDLWDRSCLFSHTPGARIRSTARYSEVHASPPTLPSMIVGVGLRR